MDTTPTSLATIPPRSSSGPRGRDLAELILTECGTTAPGTQLPTERRLAQQLGVTRAAVRRALSYLEAAGRISREVGRGTFLVGTPEALADDFGPADVMVARELFEPQVLPLVITHATARDFVELDHCLRGGESAQGPEDFEQWDDAFHRAIVVAAHNRLLLHMYSSIETARHGPLWGTLKRSHDSPDRRAFYIADHQRIVEALRTRELDAAVEAMRRHLERVRANLLGTVVSARG